MEKHKPIPFGIIDVDPKITEELKKYFTGTAMHSGFVKVGPNGYFFPSKYREEGPKFYNMQVRPSDVFVVTFPRSGTTWVQEMVWLIANDLDFDTARKTHVFQRYNFLELPTFVNEKVQLAENTNSKLNSGANFHSIDLDTPSLPSISRFIKSHLPFSLLPPSILDSKVVYILRDPRDVAVSYYRHNRLIKIHGYIGDFRRYWDYFVKGLVSYTPYFDHVKEAWSLKDHPNLLFLCYEDLCKDLPTSLRQIASFFNKQLTDDQVEVLRNHLTFENFKRNESTNFEVVEKMGKTVIGEDPFFFKGQSGGWKSYFDEDMAQEAQKWMDQNLQGTDIRFSGLYNCASE